MVSKLIPEAPKSRILKSKKLAISISVLPGSTNFKRSLKAWSEMAQAFLIVAISLGLLICLSTSMKLVVALSVTPAS